jgi:hypothetical protein
MKRCLLVYAADRCIRFCPRGFDEGQDLGRFELFLPYKRPSSDGTHCGRQADLNEAALRRTLSRARSKLRKIFGSTVLKTDPSPATMTLGWLSFVSRVTT